jgi:hypothetical protein
MQSVASRIGTCERKERSGGLMDGRAKADGGPDRQTKKRRVPLTSLKDQVVYCRGIMKSLHAEREHTGRHKR